MEDIAGNLHRVLEAIAAACQRVGRVPDDVLLIAVSKTVDVERIRQAIAAGVPALGENRVQEARAKVAVLGHPVEYHLVGSLQTNKAREAVHLFDRIHSVDRIELARELDRRAHAAGRTVNVLAQVNLGEEERKGGVAPDDLEPLLDEMTGLPGVHVDGLMAIPPVAATAEESRPYFRRLRDLARRHGLPHLSMGMSADYEVAIEEGATMVRVGTAIFGARPGRDQAASGPAPASREATRAAEAPGRGGR
jgi:pyridoxal phosphate enzyme (YggS family)